MARTPMAAPRGTRVRELREGKGWTKTQLARRMGPPHTRQGVWLIEKSTRMSVAIMSAVAAALGVDLGDVADPEEEEEAA